MKPCFRDGSKVPTNTTHPRAGGENKQLSKGTNMRTIEQVEHDLQGWKTFEATCQEDYDHACQRVRELTAERNWIIAGYAVSAKALFFRPNVPCVRVPSFDEHVKRAAKIAGVPLVFESNPMTGNTTMWPA